MTLGTTSQAYGEPSYWDNRYAQETSPFDWYQKYPCLSPLLHLYLPPPPHLHRVLVVGCGNSAFSEGMVDDGYMDVVNVDISSVVIDAMKKKYSNRPQLKYIKMDVRDMSEFEAGSFDAVIDKGTLDSLLITYGAPSYRLRLLRESWSCTIKLHVIEKLPSKESSGHKKWQLTSSIPLDDDGSSLEAALGKNLDVHYIYVCIKDGSLRPGSTHETPLD
ncbi:hypothetical protein RHMOL_Rhmol04G0380800 [Rhododendron molle]|uniref:Uncharacterized protein n=1 Tax=Rhododendron molle TaxID=49168 RepID=A0ACC0PAA7_RHOML|nr:hypothetical protein RHMOL_Rhmol04G0380800 [Rhododendron molle]